MNLISIEQIEKHLFELQDIKYRDFNAKLIPSVNPEFFIGVRTPASRAYAKELCHSGILEQSDEEKNFLNCLPHKYFEENQLHAFIISEEKDFCRCVNLIEKFLPYIDNWATCDQLCPKIFKKNCFELLPFVKKWLVSTHTYTVRFAIKVLMQFFLDQNFSTEYLDLVCFTDSHDEYYIKMMQAWYFATALAKQYEKTLPYIEQKRLEKWTHNKAIQKACESFRVSEEHKEYLKKWIQN